MSVFLEVAAFFIHEMSVRDVPVTINDDGTFAVQMHKLTYRISLDQLSKEYEDERDIAKIQQFIDKLLHHVQEPPTWKDAQPRLFPMAESYGNNFGKALHKSVSSELCRVLVYVLPDDMGVVWLTPGLVKAWRQTAETIEKIAEFNLAELLDRTKFHVQEFDNYKLGMFITPSLLKASFLFAPNLKDIVEPRLAWPILTILPCPDFAYLLRPEDEKFLPRLRPVVVSEYFRHNHTISTEIYRVDDHGIKAIKRFPLGDLGI